MSEKRKENYIIFFSRIVNVMNWVNIMHNERNSLNMMKGIYIINTGMGGVTLFHVNSLVT